MEKVYKHILCVRTINGVFNVSNGQQDNQENRCLFFFFLEILFGPSLGIYLRHMVNVKEFEISPRVNRYVC